MKKEEIIEKVNNYLLIYPNDDHGLKTYEFLCNNDLYWQRENLIGHITASAWALNPERSKVILIHHKALNAWFQPGGHIESQDLSLSDACHRELIEETGLSHAKLTLTEIFDIDVHEIPASNKSPLHYHYDIRMMFEVNETNLLFDPKESNNLQWVDFALINKYTKSESVTRMVEKTIMA